LDGVALGDDTPRLARYLLEDFLHYASTRKTAGRKALLIVDEFSALRVSNAAALLERLRSFGCGVVIAAQSVEGLHDDPNERARLLGAATTVIAHRLADPELVAARAGTTKRAERSHQLDPTGATGMGSLRIQETYRIDPNDLRNLPPGVAWITTAGRAAKTAVALARAEPASLGRSLPGGSPGCGAGGLAEAAFGAALTVIDGPEELVFVEARLVPATDRDQAVGDDGLTGQESGPSTPASRCEQQALPMEDPSHGDSAQGREPQLPAEQPGVDLLADAPPAQKVSPYAEGL
jgi:hypothetical protein